MMKRVRSSRRSILQYSKVGRFTSSNLLVEVAIAFINVRDIIILIVSTAFRVVFADFQSERRRVGEIDGGVRKNIGWK